MGTELQTYTINPFGSVLKESSNIRFGVHKFCVDDWSYKQPITWSGACNSMERFLDKQNTESIKKTMKAQDEIFKHQVRELHRLYNVQKMMMDEMITQKRRWINHPNSTSHSLAFVYNTNNNYNLNLEAENRPNSSRETSGSCSADTNTIRARKAVKVVDIDLERPADHQDSSAVDILNNRRLMLFDQMRRNDVEDSDLELTLSIGVSSSSSKSYQRETNRELDSSASFKSENNVINNNNNQDGSGPSTPMSSSSTTLDQEKKRPHWLLQGLSINKST